LSGAQALRGTSACAKTGGRRLQRRLPAEVTGKIEREVRVNERIRAREVRLIDENGVQLGIVAVPEALRIAGERNLDLIEVAPGAQPPVCRIMDYGKHKYESAKRDREGRRKTKVGEVRLLRMKPQISRHDLDIKIRKLKELLGEGNKVRISLRFRGREMSRPEMGAGLMATIAKDLAEVAMVEGPVRRENRMMTMMLAPRPVTRPPKEPREPKEKKEKVAPHAQQQVQAEPIAEPIAEPRRQSEDAEDSGEAG
jgi:translation initiation factor IF-3